VTIENELDDATPPGRTPEPAAKPFTASVKAASL
jgi:hypothetical protein